MRINGAMGMTGAPAGTVARRAKPGEFSLPQAESDTAPTRPPALES